MKKTEFDPAMRLGEKIAQMPRQELYTLVIKLCQAIREEVGSRDYRGGIYPENISLSDDGSVGIGPGLRSAWEGQELQFVAPELYWDGKCSPASDVYSLGLLLCYGVSGGALPLEGSSPNAQLSRMNGKDLPAPEAAGERLGEIIEKALRFQASQRYQTVEELQIMLENCAENKFVQGSPAVEAIFKKNEGELSDLEKMMVDIITAGDPVSDSPAAEPVVAAAEEQPLTEETVKTILEPNKPEIAPEAAEDKTALVEEYFGKQEPAEDVDDVRVYEPPHHEKKSKREPIPILTAEKNPELEPVVLQNAPKVKAPVRKSKEESGRTGREPVRENNVKEVVKKRRRRPVLVVLILCGILILAAVVADVILRSYDPVVGPTETLNPSVDLTDSGVVVINEPVQPEVPEEPQPTEEVVRESMYQAFREDLSWTEAQEECRRMGGHLVVISNEEEFNKVVQMAEEMQLNVVWIGCHRENDQLIWEVDDPIEFAPWGYGEPSGYDSGDGAPEDYVMLWNLNGVWQYNDSRNDPIDEFPSFYSGKMGYVLESGDR